MLTQFLSYETGLVIAPELLSKSDFIQLAVISQWRFCHRAPAQVVPSL